MEPFIGQIIQVGFNFAPRDWSTCQGQLVSIQQNSALFSLLGTTFGGNGQNTFGLPDAQGRVLVGTGQGAGLQPYQVGQMSGTESVVLNSNQMPAHVHSVNLTASMQAITDNTLANTTETPEEGARLGVSLESGGTTTPVIYVPAGQAGVAVNLAGATVSGPTTPAGGNQPFPILQPYLAMTTIIAMNGIFPSRP